MQTDKSAVNAITSKVWAIVNALPQREAIQTSDANFWVNEVVGTYGELAIWHATRAGGFGGSQIGALVRNFMGERADHEQSAHDIVAGSLLSKLPDNPNGPMRRGIAMEPQHRRWFQEKYNAVRDDAGFAILSKSVGQCQWMRYSPDDLVFMPVYNGTDVVGKKRSLIDYKAPSNIEEAAKISFQYVCQLHMGRLVCETNGLPIDELMLSQFDWGNWALKDDVVPHVPELDGLIMQAGDHFWSFVMRGELPPYVRKPRLEGEDALREQLGPISLKMARLKAMVSAADAHIKTFEETIKPELQKFRLGAAKVQLSGISYTASPKFDDVKVFEKLPLEVVDALPLQGNSTTAYDSKAMVAKLKELEVDVKQFLKPGSINSEALYDALLVHGIDADALMGESLTGRTDKKLVADVKAWFEREFADLVPSTGAVEAVNVAALPVEAVQEMVAEGQEMPRYVPRSVCA